MPESLAGAIGFFSIIVLVGCWWISDAMSDRNEVLSKLVDVLDNIALTYDRSVPDPSSEDEDEEP